MIWYLLAAAALLSLLIYRGGPNAVWGTATVAAAIGVVIAFLKPSFEWSIVGKAIVIGALIGVVFELLPRMFGRRAR